VEKQEKFEEGDFLKLSRKSSFQFLSMSVMENKVSRYYGSSENELSARLN
jgi:hypothetical protein